MKSAAINLPNHTCPSCGSVDEKDYNESSNSWTCMSCGLEYEDGDYGLDQTASNTIKIKLSRQEWTDMGKQAGWLKTSGMSEESDQMKSELIVLFTSESDGLRELDENFLLNKVGDVHGEDIGRSIEKLFRNKINLREYAILKKDFINAIMPKVTEIVNRHKMAFRNNSEMTLYLEIAKRMLDDQFRDVFGLSDDSFEKTWGYGKTLFNGDEFVRTKYGIELEESISDLVQSFEDILDDERERSQRKSLIKNYIGKTVYLSVVKHQGKPYFNRPGILRSLNGDMASVDVDIDGEIINMNIRASLLRFHSL